MSTLRRFGLSRCLAGGAAVALLLCAVASSSLAEDDGGARSVFAYGAGNRALALGGAYAALANDASAPLWNAAGLGLLDRTELQFTQTSYYAIGLSEQFGSFAVPHWKWGVGSVTFRRFAVDGIEQRDDRNALVDGDLSNSETELLLSYGRRIGSAWSAGAALKVRRQSLAGFDDSGVGLDLGVLVKPVKALAPNHRYGERVTFGLALRNAVRPELRLYNERVGDPAAIRFGTAVHLPVFGRLFNAAVDLEKTSNMNLRVHSGAELRLHQLLALRIGVSDGQFATGMGLQYGGVTVDYAFEQNEVENVHRLGAAITFGPTVAQRRQAVLDARETELRQRFDAAFEERQTQRVDELLSQAEAAQRQEAYGDALELLAVVEALEPDHAQVSSRQLACWIELGRQAEGGGDFARATVSYTQALTIAPNDPGARSGLERARSESDRIAARSSDIRQQFALAMDAFSEQDLARAQDGFERILADAPNDLEAAQMLERTHRAIDGRIGGLIHQANQDIALGQLDEAQAAIDEVRHLDPEAHGLGRTRARLAAAREEQNAAMRTGPDTSRVIVPPAQPGAQARSITAEQLQEAERLYQQAIKAMSDNQSNEAIRYLELVWAIDPGYQQVAEHLKREYLTRGMEYFADGALDEAVSMWENALRIDPDDQRAKGYLSRAREQATRTREILGGQ